MRTAISRPHLCGVERYAPSFFGLFFFWHRCDLDACLRVPYHLERVDFETKLDPLYLVPGVEAHILLALLTVVVGIVSGIFG